MSDPKKELSPEEQAICEKAKTAINLAYTALNDSKLSLGHVSERGPIIGNLAAAIFNKL